MTNTMFQQIRGSEHWHVHCVMTHGMWVPRWMGESSAPMTAHPGLGKGFHAAELH